MENGSFTIEGLLHGSGGYDNLVANWHYSPVTDANGCNLTSGYIVETGGQ
jgi:TPP-dependent 2-oxoacid decarboxylase